MDDLQFAVPFSFREEKCYKYESKLRGYTSTWFVSTDFHQNQWKSRSVVHRALIKPWKWKSNSHSWSHSTWLKFLNNFPQTLQKNVEVNRAYADLFSIITYFLMWFILLCCHYNAGQLRIVCKWYSLYLNFNLVKPPLCSWLISIPWSKEYKTFSSFASSPGSLSQFLQFIFTYLPETQCLYSFPWYICFQFS